MLTEETSLSWESASQICQATCRYASEHNLKICVCVLDRHGNPLAMQRINHAPLPSTDIARKGIHRRQFWLRYPPVATAAGG